MERLRVGPTLLLALTLGLVARRAAAQDIAPPTEKTEGGGGKSEGGPRGPQPADRVKLAGQLGGSWATGNTQSFLLNAALRSALRVGRHQLTASGLFAYTTAREVPEGAPEGAPAQRFVADDNVYGRLRYDFFLGEKNTAFVGFLGFRDPSSGFLYRWMPYAGLLQVLVASPGRFELWAEGGYRLAWERLDRDARAAAEGLGPWRVVHGPSAFLGTQISLSDTTDFDGGVEALTDVRNPGDLRVNTFASLLSKIAGDLSFGASFNSRYLVEPIGDRARLDTSMQVVFVHQHTFALGPAR
jgi:hypothetical protein